METKIKCVTKKLINEYINCWSENKELPLRENLLYAKDDNKYIGVDNKTGNCWVEEFDKENDVIQWLSGIEKEDIFLKKGKCERNVR